MHTQPSPPPPADGLTNKFVKISIGDKVCSDLFDVFLMFRLSFEDPTSEGTSDIILT